MSTDMEKDNFFVCVEYMKPKCPAVVRMENDDFIVKNINNHPSARMRAKLIKKEVMNEVLSSGDAQPLRVLWTLLRRFNVSTLPSCASTGTQLVKG